VRPTKKLQKARNINFYGWVLCIIRLYPITTSTIKAKSKRIYHSTWVSYNGLLCIKKKRSIFVWTSTKYVGVFYGSLKHSQHLNLPQGLHSYIFMVLQIQYMFFFPNRFAMFYIWIATFFRWITMLFDPYF
jgi:hypothetical protein